MKLATILPTKYLWLSADEDYHMCLAHLIGKDDEYTEFYRDMVARGHYVIMDNSVIEDAQVTIEELCNKARYVGAQEIILPDKFLCARETLKSSAEALTYVRTHCPELKVMCVPQGRTLAEWFDCYRVMMDWHVDCIGIPKVLSSFAETGNLERGTVLAQIKEHFEDYNEEHPGRPVSIHLLGCWNSPLELTIIEKLQAAGKLPTVRGCDSAIAYAFTKLNLDITSQDRIQGHKIDFDDKDVNMELLDKNINVWKDCVDLSTNKMTKMVEIY